MPLKLLFFIEGLLSFAGNLLFVGIFFFTSNVWGWGIIPNFLLATAQGVVYVIAALLTEKVSHLLGRRPLLILTNILLAAVSIAAALSPSHALTVALVLAYVPLIAFNWPILETLASEGAPPKELSRRIGIYNLVWAGTGALTIAVQGTLQKIDSRAIFIVPAIVHTLITLTLLVTQNAASRRARFSERNSSSAAQRPSPTAHPAEPTEAPSILLAERSLALSLARISQPAAYVVLYTVSALLPLVPAIRNLDPALGTVIGSIWLISRWLAFLLLGATTFWHARPRLLLLAAFFMGLAFLGVSISPSILAGPSWSAWDLPTLIASQIILGAAMGLIYTASLYFGMVLSEASTEHAGYHEALIGLGQVIGPGVGALTQWRWPGASLAGVAAVAGIILLSLLASSVVTLRSRRRRE